MGRRVSFPYDRVLTPIGFVYVPVARVELTYGRRSFLMDMTVDSGADLTMIPYQVGLNLGMRPGKCGIAMLSGIAGGIPYILKKAALRIGPFRLPCRVAWAQRDEVPMLIGRVDVLDRLAVTLDGRLRKTTFRI